MNNTENVTELLAHARTVDTRRSSPQLPRAPGNEAMQATNTAWGEKGRVRGRSPVTGPTATL